VLFLFMRFRTLLLLCLFAILTGAIFVYPQLPRFFSSQDKLLSLDIQNDYDPSLKIAIFNNRPILIPELILPVTKVLGDSDPNINKRIEVNLTTQTLTTFENDKPITSFITSSGTFDSTPTGVFHIWAKVMSQKMSGGSKELGDYYYFPNVPYILFFYNDQTPKDEGYSIHGAYWHNNFGVPMSRGCINMKTPEAQLIYNWADENTPIIIYGHYQSPAK